MQVQKGDDFMSDEIYFNYPGMGDIIQDLNACRGTFDAIRAKVDGIVSRLNSGFIAQAQTSFAGVHTELQPDFDRFDKILGTLPQVIDESIEYNREVDAIIAQKIRQIMTTTRI
jgi:uncharacterized protein YukE